MPVEMVPSAAGGDIFGYGPLPASEPPKLEPQVFGKRLLPLAHLVGQVGLQLHAERILRSVVLIPGRFIDHRIQADLRAGREEDACLDRHLPLTTSCRSRRVAVASCA